MTRTMRAMARPFLMAALLASIALALGACARPRESSAPHVDTIPVVKPFALERAGTRVAFEFEIPGQLDRGSLRGVSIGFRVRYRPREDSHAQDDRVRAYLDEAAMPIRLIVQRWEAGQWVPVTLVTLVTLNKKNRAGSYAYLPHPDPVFVNHGPAHWDAGELARHGYWDEALAYGDHYIAGFQRAEKGRYRLELETLAGHPPLEGSVYELVIAHRRIF